LEKKAPTKTRLYFTIFLGMLVMSFTSPLLKTALNLGATSEAVTFYRTLGVFLFLLPVVAFSPEKRAEIKSYSKIHFLMILCLGSLKAIGMLTWIEGLKYTSVFVASTLTRTSPIWVIIGGTIFLKEKTALKAVSGMLLSFVGVALIGISDIADAGNSWLGIILVMLCAFFQAGDMLVNRTVRQKGSLWVTQFLTFSVAFVEVLIYGIITKANFGPFSPQVYLVIAALAFFCTLLGQSVSVWVLKYIKAATVSIVQLISPFIAAITAFFILNEKPGIMTFVGALVMISGLYIYFKEEAKEHEHEALEAAKAAEQIAASEAMPSASNDLVSSPAACYCPAGDSSCDNCEGN